MNLILENEASVLTPTIRLNEEIHPVTVGGESIDLGGGLWMIVTTIGPRVGLFGHTLIPKYRTYRFVRFFSRSWGPGNVGFWSLKGIITFDFGEASSIALGISTTASDEQWRKLKLDAIKRRELLPEPLLSTTAFRILGSYAEY